MKSKHILIIESDVYSEMRVHVVWVGISDRDQSRRDYIIKASAIDKDIYFKKYDCEVCDFLHRLAEQVYPSLSPRDAFLKFDERNIVSSSLSDVLKIIKNSSNPCNVKNLKSQTYEHRKYKPFQRV